MTLTITKDRATSPDSPPCNVMQIPTTTSKAFKFMNWPNRGRGLGRQTTGVSPGYHPFVPGKFLFYQGFAAEIKTVQHGLLWTDLTPAERSFLRAHFGADCRVAFHLYTRVDLERVS